MGFSVETAEALGRVSPSTPCAGVRHRGRRLAPYSRLIPSELSGSLSFGLPGLSEFGGPDQTLALLHPEENVGRALNQGFLLAPENNRPRHSLAPSGSQILRYKTKTFACYNLLTKKCLTRFPARSGIMGPPIWVRSDDHLFTAYSMAASCFLSSAQFSRHFLQTLG